MKCMDEDYFILLMEGIFKEIFLIVEFMELQSWDFLIITFLLEIESMVNKMENV